jgi:hypothetical protein
MCVRDLRSEEAVLTVQQTLVIHPDKTPHPRAPEAFDLLKKVNRVT